MCQLPRYPGPVEVAPGEKVPYLFALLELAAVGKEDAGQVLRQTLRGVRIWMEDSDPGPMPAPEKAREVAPELAATLPALWRILREAQPDEETMPAVGLACMHVATWAEKAAAYRTALAFFQAAEDADCDNPHYAYHVGRVARKLALYDAAEGWLKWAHWLARARGQWEVAALCTSGLGNLHRQRGNLPLATRYHELTRRIARRHNLHTVEGDALYDLVGMSFDFGDPRQGMAYARRAVEAYGPGHSRIYRLAKDIAWLWMDQYGQFENAAHVFTALLDHIWEPDCRVLLLSSLARAAAGAGWAEIFEAMWIETWSAIRQQPVRAGHAGALIQLAYGAGNLGYWNRAALAASEAVGVARERKEGEMLIVAEGILGAVRTGIIAEEAAREVFKDRRFTPATGDEVSITLAAELAGAMGVRRDDAPSGPARTRLSDYGFSYRSR